MKMTGKIYKLLLQSLMMLLTLNSVAQNKTVKVSGTVSDSFGPVAGATVYEKGNTSNGVIAGTDGRYSISVKADAILVFTCLGYADVEEAVSGRSTVDVTMKESFETLSAAEVVSIGYGSVARRDLTGSVAKVNMDDIVKSTNLNFDQALQGRVAGMVVTTSDGQVGAEANIIIRGNNSLTQSSAPLYVIDGFPTESSFAAALNPADIESVDVLKDASASAIYGARGANGVIVITTKRGNLGKPKVSFNASWTGSTLAKKTELLDGYEFVRLHSEWAQSRNGTTGNIYFSDYDANGVLSYNRYTLEDYKDKPYVDWQDYVYRNALSQNYNVSVAGGSKASGTMYNVSLSSQDQNGILINSNYKRYTGKFALSQEFGDRLTLDVNASYSYNETNGITPTSSASASVITTYFMYMVWGFRPTRPLRYGLVDDTFRNELVDNEVVATEGFRFNPAASVQNEYSKKRQDLLTANAAFTWKMAEGLKLRVSAGYTLNQRRNEDFNGSNTRTGHPGSPVGYGPNATIAWTRDAAWINENILTWNHVFGRDHNFDAMAGLTFQGDRADYHGTRSTHIENESLGLESIYTGVMQNFTPWRRDWTMASALARVNYNYKHKYYFTASVRADGSSRFPKSNRWGVFPSGSIAWTFTNEPFMASLAQVLNNGKARLSWGRTGNNRTNTPYDFYAQMATLPGSSESLDYVRDGKIVAGYFPSNMANPYLKWETTEQTDLGFDLGFLQDRVKLTVDLYQKTTYDLLLQADLPASSGFTQAMVNVGSMRNRGLEILLSAVPVRTKGFQWTATVNFGMNRNTVTGLSTGQNTLPCPNLYWYGPFNNQTAYITRTGLPTGLMYGFIYEGTYKQDDFMNNNVIKDGIPYMSAYPNTYFKPGDPRYRDINGDGVIDDNDRTVIGIGQPLHTGGIENKFEYKCFDLSVFMNWSYGNNILNANKLVFESYPGNQLNQFHTMVNAWSRDRNPYSDIPRPGAMGIDYYSSRVIEDGSFLRIKTVTLGYTLSPKALKKLGISSARVYVTADNLYTFTSYSGPDPEVSTRNSVLTPGFDWSAYPRAKSLTGGISVTF